MEKSNYLNKSNLQHDGILTHQALSIPNNTFKRIFFIEFANEFNEEQLIKFLLPLGVL